MASSPARAVILGNKVVRSHHEYVIEVESPDAANSSDDSRGVYVVSRRFREFDEFHGKLRSALSGSVPDLPPKKYFGNIVRRSFPGGKLRSSTISTPSEMRLIGLREKERGKRGRSTANFLACLRKRRPEPRSRFAPKATRQALLVLRPQAITQQQMPRSLQSSDASESASIAS